MVARTLAGITRPYPTGFGVHLDQPQAWTPHTEQFPAFYGCYDWHSSVHSHWQLVRILRYSPEHPLGDRIRDTISTHFTTSNIEAEMASVHLRPGFEMPYGMAWLLQLGLELHEWDDAEAKRWLNTLRPLLVHAAGQFSRYTSTRTLPVRTGTHNQSAFALSLVYDWASATDDRHLVDDVRRAGLDYYQNDTDAPLEYEPSAVDFLSPTLAEADLMRRLIPARQFQDWIDGFLPDTGVPLTTRIAPQPVIDPSNGQLAHIAGLNISRSWMAQGIASALPAQHRIAQELEAVAAEHRHHGIPLALHPDYMVSHWAPSFVVYLETGRGLGSAGSV